ncbi:unnamed protein product, partial [Sphagnum compactum]
MSDVPCKCSLVSGSAHDLLAKKCEVTWRFLRNQILSLYKQLTIILELCRVNPRQRILRHYPKCSGVATEKKDATPTGFVADADELYGQSTA